MKLKYLVLLVLFVANFSFSQESPQDASNPLGKDSSATVISPKPVVMKVTIGGTDSDLVQGNGEAIDSNAPEQISNKPNDVQQVKVEILPNSISVTDISVKREMKDGNRTVFDYGEIRGISGTVRSILIKDGYKVVQGKPAVGGVSQGDEFFDILDRAKRGDFGKAQYVLFGVLSDLTQTNGRERISGTDSYMQINSIDIAVDYRIVDTQSTEVVASFTALGNATDNRISGALDQIFPPNSAKLIKQVSTSLAEEVRNHLADQSFLKNGISSGSTKEISNRSSRYSDDAKSLKVYRK